MNDQIWSFKGREFLHCNCAYGCPCQFNGLPTHGNCQAVLGVEIHEGHHGATRLDGLKFAAVMKWPGAIHEGRGAVLPIVEERADPQQREAILRIMSGMDTEPGASIFQVFAATWEKVHDPVFTQIELSIDSDERRGSLRVPRIIEGRGEPIVNPVTGNEHRARINLPDGFEYTFAEVARGWSKASGPIELDLQDSHAHFADLHMTSNGVVHR